MLKISTYTEGNVTTFELVGKLAGPWVNELEQCWSKAEIPKGQPFRVDLRATTYIDGDGKALLVRMHGQGADFVASGCMTKCIVEQITGEDHSSPCAPDEKEPTSRSPDL